ncbi:hypothetical protein PR048_013799 [Dryococelus australis]|uniref:Uncharacterized protein n=1 Tax=Dryococelus australis TaxID=614101 RepID=A0ABQ9HT62_9NEOP|nr:hypothetical protein PR048_013799 [Dryococelus australis]
MIFWTKMSSLLNIYCNTRSTGRHQHINGYPPMVRDLTLRKKCSYALRIILQVVYKQLPRGLVLFTITTHLVWSLYAGFCNRLMNTHGFQNVRCLNMRLNLLGTVCTIHTILKNGQTKSHVVQLFGAIIDFCSEYLGRYHGRLVNWTLHVTSSPHLANILTVLAY